jgi:hypothetical protein
MKTIYGKLHLQGNEELTGTGWLPPGTKGEKQIKGGFR